MIIETNVKGNVHLWTDLAKIFGDLTWGREKGYQRLRKANSRSNIWFLTCHIYELWRQISKKCITAEVLCSSFHNNFYHFWEPPTIGNPIILRIMVAWTRSHSQRQLGGRNKQSLPPILWDLQYDGLDGSRLSTCPQWVTGPTCPTSDPLRSLPLTNQDPKPKNISLNEHLPRPKNLQFRTRQGTGEISIGRI